MFGLLSISEPYPHPSKVEAIGESVVISIRGEDARLVMHKHSELALRVVDLLVEHVHIAHERLRSMASERVDRRLTRVMLKCVKNLGSNRTVKFTSL